MKIVAVVVVVVVEMMMARGWQFANECMNAHLLLLLCACVTVVKCRPKVLPCCDVRRVCVCVCAMQFNVHTLSLRLYLSTN